MPEVVDNPDNPVTDDKVELGTMLFYDPRLSKSGFISCNSCHIGAFERTLTTPDRFDKFLRGDHDALSYQELAGLEVFINQGCVGCHAGPALEGRIPEHALRLPLLPASTADTPRPQNR